MAAQEANEPRIYSSVRELLNNASRIVEQWPDWKKGILQGSARTSNSVPRPVQTPPEQEQQVNH